MGQRSEESLAESVDGALEQLLGRASQPVLSSGFALGVLQAVCPQEARETATGATVPTAAIPRPSQETLLPKSASPLRPVLGFFLKGVAVAAIAAVGAAVALTTWKAPSRLPAIELSQHSPTEEELFLSALSSMELSSHDIVVVAQLGEVLDAELAERPSWLDLE